MSMSANDIMVFIDPSSEHYYEDSIREGVCIGYYVHGEKGIYVKIYRARTSVPISYVCF
jgi:hypothetical protein